MTTKSAKRTSKTAAKTMRKFPHAKVEKLETSLIEAHEGVPRAVLTAASQAFVKWGYAKTGLTDIAKAAGTSRANVYNYFPGGKEEILIALLRVKTTAFNEQFSKLVPIEGPAADILMRRLVYGIQHTWQDQLTQELIADNQTAHLRQYDVVSVANDFWRELFSHAEARGELRPGVTAENGFRWNYLVLSSILHVSQPHSVGSINDIRKQLEQFLIPALFVEA